ncbi:MAG: hemolysin III family protein [Trueperella sp.]|nr:hemolysin III family protein [Trueperella sp.]
MSAQNPHSAEPARPGAKRTTKVGTASPETQGIAPTPSSRAERKAYYAALPKPKARGWIHAIMAPLALANSVLLLIFAPTIPARVAVLVFGISAVLLFGNSGIYHRGNWSDKVHAVLRRIDHANIFLLIAGTYTPLSVMLLEPKTAALVLGIVWTGAIIGTLIHVFHINAPRWFQTFLYVALGWVATWFLPEFWATGGPAIVFLLLAGGLAYTVGAVFYAMRWPNPWPNHFGFHEFFHVGTVIGYVCHSVAVWFAIFS